MLKKALIVVVLSLMSLSSFANTADDILSQSNQSTRQTKVEHCSKGYRDLVEDYAIAQERSREGKYRSTSDMIVAFQILESRENHLNVECYQMLGRKQWNRLKVKLDAEL